MAKSEGARVPGLEWIRLHTQLAEKNRNGRYGQISAGETPTEGTRERPVQGRTQKTGFPNADALEKYERQTSVVSPPASYYDGTMSEENRELWAEGMDALQDNSPYVGFSGGFDEQDDASIDGWRIHRRNTPTGNTVYEFRDAKSSTPNRVAYLIKQSDIDAGHSPTWLDERQRSFFNVLTNNKR